MIRWKSVAFGAVAFLSGHALEVAEWPSFAPASPFKPWFLNSGRAAALIAAWLFTAAAIEGIAARSPWREAISRGWNIALGATLAMGAVLYASGPGTLAPIALAIGAAIAAASAICGVLLGAALTHGSRARGR
jgi:hypothetical protein